MAVIYDGIDFRTGLEARWAAFFDLAGWKWRYNPVPVDDWKPDFEVTFPCGHSECGATHLLLVSVLPVADLQTVRGHPALQYAYGGRTGVHHLSQGSRIHADAGALFGADPSVTAWEMSHGAGGGLFDVPYWVDGSARLWDVAGGRVFR